MSGTPTLGDWMQKITAIRVGLINHNCHSCFELHDNDTWSCGAGGVVTTRRVGRQLRTNRRHVEPHLNTLDLSNQHTKFRRPALPCCRAALPQSFENSAKGVPQGNFSISSKFKSPPKPPDMMANFMLVSYLKTVLRCRHPFSHNELISAGHFWAKKTCHTAG